MAAAMDFHALSRRELQALCKRNGVRANMTNAAMADALQSLPTVDGVDEIGTAALCLPTPSRSTMKSALKAAAAIGEEQQHGSPLPRGRRVSVMSPEAIRLDVEEGEDEMKRDLIKEIVRTPGVALRSTSRRARATPAPIPTPATTRRTAAARKVEEAAPTPATLRRSQRTAARKAAAPVVEEVTATKTTTRRSARSKVMVDLEQEVEDMAVALQEVKVQEEDPKDVASDEKCDEEEEATKILGGNSKEEESEEGEEVVSSAAPTELAVISVMSCDDPKEEEIVATGEEPAKTQEVMEDSPILGVLSKPEPVEPLSEKIEDASVGDGLGFGKLSALKEITGEMNDKEVDADEVPEEKLPADVTDDKTSEEDDLNEVEKLSAVEIPQADLTGDKTSEEEDLNEVKEGSAYENPQADRIDAESSEEDDLDGEYSEESDIDEESNEEGMLDEESAAEEYASSEETDDESDPSEVATDSDEVEVEKLQVAMEDGLTAEANQVDDEEDDFSGDLPSDFDNADNFSDDETESDATVVISSASKAAVVKTLDDSSVTEASSEEEVSQQEVEASVNSIVKSLDEFTFTVEGAQKDELTEEMKSTDDAEDVGAKELKKEKKKKKPTVQELNATSMRKLKTMLKEELIAKAAAGEGKRLALAELDDNAGGVDC
ncbi:hypothetical protein OsI_08581 [Oryza sativa Indica Group]|uniref:Uncharacterized protein n=1 Tax=Oryza sativa subsp. indica TaxID=39946 RepID=A2X8M0_ORYSI|nr:hypothetical protein OsI_08581 [Oryza sativa Indica Group]